MSTFRTINSIARRIKRKLITTPKRKYRRCYHLNRKIHSKRFIGSSKFSRIQQLLYPCSANRIFASSASSASSSSSPSSLSSSPSSNKPQHDKDDSIDQEDDNIDHRLFNPPTPTQISNWDKWEWIFSVSSLVQFLGFLSYDFILLRFLSLLSAGGLMIAHRGRRFFVGWFWAFSFATANVVALYIMLREKYSQDLGGLNNEEATIYHTFFEPFQITPLEYKQIIKLAHITTMPRGETLTICGLVGDKVFLLLSGQCLVVNDDGDTVGLISGGSKKSFVGEIGMYPLYTHNIYMIYNLYFYMIQCKQH